MRGISQYTLHEHLRNFGAIISRACEKENLSAMYTLSRDWADRVNKNYERINYHALKQLKALDPRKVPQLPQGW